MTHVWDQKEDHSREQVKPGTYKVRPGNVIGSIGDPVQEFRVLPQS
ncbi:MAG: hypothetical protein HZA82_06045 [Thaumarchaeota archaeon]|nr:hypothetical protein [Nitrososphaerota archaeon]